MIVEVNRDNLLTYARQALSHDGSPKLFGATYHLANLALAIRSNNGAFLGFCQKALVDNQATYPEQEITVDVLDGEADPAVPVGLWSESIFTPTYLDPLRAEGVEGVYDVDRGTWQFFDRQAQRGVQVIPHLGALPPWEQSFPLRNFLHWACAKRGARLVHAGSLAVGDRGVLLIGAGGSGKSGTTLSGILAGLGSTGDDYVAIEAGEEGFVARPVMKLMKQDANGLRRNGLGDEAIRFGMPNWQNKYEFDFEALEAGRRLDRMRIVAIVRPQISDADRPVVSACSPVQVMQQMTLSTLAQLPGEWRSGLDFMSRLVRSVPCYSLKLTAAPAPNIEAIAELIAGSRP